MEKHGKHGSLAAVVELFYSEVRQHNDSIRKLVGLQTAVKSSSSSSKQAIQKYVDDATQKLNQMAHSLNGEIDDMASYKLKALERGKRLCIGHIRQLADLSEKICKALEFSEDEEHYESLLEEATRLLQSGPDLPQSSSEFCMLFSPNLDLQNELSKADTIGHIKCPSALPDTVKLSCVSSHLYLPVESNTPLFMVEAMNDITELRDILEFAVFNPLGKSLVELRLVEEKDGMYALHFTPCMVGVYRCEARIHGLHVMGSPAAVNVGNARDAPTLSQRGDSFDISPSLRAVDLLTGINKLSEAHSHEGEKQYSADLSQSLFKEEKPSRERLRKSRWGPVEGEKTANQTDLKGPEYFAKKPANNGTKTDEPPNSKGASKTPPGRKSRLCLTLPQKEYINSMLFRPSSKTLLSQHKAALSQEEVSGEGLLSTDEKDQNRCKKNPNTPCLDTKLEQWDEFTFTPQLPLSEDTRPLKTEISNGASDEAEAMTGGDCSRTHGDHALMHGSSSVSSPGQPDVTLHTTLQSSADTTPANAGDSRRVVQVQSDGPVHQPFSLNACSKVTGILIGSMGRQGRGPSDSLLFPIGVTTGLNGDIIVCDSGNSMVKVFNKAYQHKFTIGGGPVDHSMKRPSAAVVNSEGDFFVKDDHQIFVFDREGHYIKVFGRKHLSRPYGLVLTECGDLVTIDHIDSCSVAVVRFDQLGKLLHKSSAIALVSSPSKKRPKCRFIAYHSAKLYLVDLGSSVIHVTNLEGVHLKKFGGFGVSPGEFREPSGITTDHHGNLLIADSKNNRIQIFSPDCEYMGPVNLSCNLKRPSDIHLTKEGCLLVSNYLQHCIKAFNVRPA